MRYGRVEVAPDIEDCVGGLSKWAFRDGNDSLDKLCKRESMRGQVHSHNRWHREKCLDIAESWQGCNTNIFQDIVDLLLRQQNLFLVKICRDLFRICTGAV
jgi:hypothetical protein